MITILISTISLIISLITITRLFLLDKDYCEFSIIDYGGNNTLLHRDVLENKFGNIPTMLKPKIQLLKSDIYDLKIDGIKSDGILPFKKNEKSQLDSEDIIGFHSFCREPENIEITYRDSKNNLYQQKLTITPFYNGGSLYGLKSPSIFITNRKWLFFRGLKRKYF